MKTPTLLVLHPKDWAQKSYAKKYGLEVHHVSIGGAVPKKLSGTPTYDGYAEAVTDEGIKDLYTAANKLKPDFFLFWLHTGLYAHHLEIVRQFSPGVKLCFWFGNHRTRLAGNVTNLKGMVDLLLLNSKEPSQFKMYRDYGIPHVATLYDGFDADLPLPEVAPTYDVFFAGESYVKAAEKNPALNFPGAEVRRQLVIRAHDEFKMACHAARKDSWPFPTLPEVYHPGHLLASRRAKIVINANHFPFRQAYTRRTIRALFSGRLHATLYIPGMEEDFKNGQDIVWFNDIDEGMDKIRWYLAHDEEREKVARAGLELALKRFTFEEALKGFANDLRRFFPEKFK